jgi:hypothetical protein
MTDFVLGASGIGGKIKFRQAQIEMRRTANKLPKMPTVVPNKPKIRGNSN